MFSDNHKLLYASSFFILCFIVDCCYFCLKSVFFIIILTTKTETYLWVKLDERLVPEQVSCVQ